MRLRPTAYRVLGAVSHGDTSALMLAASAPSLLYVVYQQRWHFSAITLTTIFGVYVLVLLAALLTVGGLSDYVGRKPVMLISFTLLVASMVLFARASSVGWLYAARIPQAFVKLLSLGAVSAALYRLCGPAPDAARGPDEQPDPQPRPRPRRAGGRWSRAVRPAAAGCSSSPWLAVLFVLTMAAMAVVPETAPRRAGACCAVPAAQGHWSAGRSRGEFTRAIPGLIAPWAQIGFTPSLTTSLASAPVRHHRPFPGRPGRRRGLRGSRSWPPWSPAACRRRAAAALLRGADHATPRSPWSASSARGTWCSTPGHALTGLGAGATLGAIMRALSVPAVARRARGVLRGRLRRRLPGVQRARRDRRGLRGARRPDPHHHRLRHRRGSKFASARGHRQRGPARPAVNQKAPARSRSPPSRPRQEQA